MQAQPDTTKKTPTDADGLVIQALPQITENNTRMSSFGSPPALLAELYKPHMHKLDLSRVEPGWEAVDLNSKYAFTVEKMQARAKEAREYLRQVAEDLERKTGGKQTEEQHVLVMSHGHFAHILTDE